MQTAGVKIGEDYQKRVSTTGGRSPTGALVSHVQSLCLLSHAQSLDFAERIDSYFAKFNMWRLEELK